MADRVKTGIDGLDRVIGGGFPRGSLVLLAGNPGTGKTVFSGLFLAGGVQEGEPGVYAGFAEPKDTLMENLSGHIGLDLSLYEAEGKLRILDFTALKEEALSTILEEILNAVQALRAGRLVIDSFSAMIQAIRDPIELRTFLQVVLGRIVRGMGCTTLMVEEVPIGKDTIGLGVEEFVADGLLRLNIGELEGRLFRDLEILKLRGTELEERRLAFTLKGGFKAFPPFKPKPVGEPRRFQPISDPSDKYSTGCMDLDMALNGGVPKGSIMLLEIDERISTLEYHLFLGPMAPEFALQGRGVLVVPSVGVDAEILRRVGDAYGATLEEFNRLITIVEVGVEEPGEGYPNVTALRGEDWREDLERVREVSRRLQAATGKPSLWIIGLDTLIAYYGEKICERILTRSAAKIRKAKSMLVALVKGGRRELAVRLSPAADIYLRLVRKHGCLLLYGVKPRTGLYAVEMDVSKGYPLPKLTPIL